MSMPDATCGEGGCLCGAVRYRLRSRPVDAGYCHCRLCRRSSGAPVQLFAAVPRRDFEWLRGAPRSYRSSSFGERWFCGECGTQLCMQVDHEPDTTDFTVASLDDPVAIRPEFHIWTASRLEWFDTRDALPRHKGDRPANAGAHDTR